MQAAFDCLSEIMEKQKKIYEALYKLSKQKQEELISGSIDILEKITKQEELLIHRVGSLETERYSCVCQLNDKYGLSADSSLSEMLAVIPKEAGNRLECLMVDMSSLLNKMDKVNKENQSLIKHSLQYVNFTIDTFSRVNDHITYGHEHDIKQEGLRSILDKRV